MGVRIKDLLTRSSDLKTGGAWFAVDNGTSVDKVSGESMVEQFSDEFLERYKALIGTPLTASTASQMEDEEKIYVYTGSETGYTAGHWYYYDETWNDGGVYNSTAVTTDKTLSVSDAPADAKSTGDSLSALTNRVDDLEDNAPHINSNGIIILSNG